jgi:sterol desaturase/sphingolipid hydroxylase (fatty acid hydroxylase superfamily)
MDIFIGYTMSTFLTGILPSWRSVKTFCFTNGLLLGLAFVQYKFTPHLQTFFEMYQLFLLRNYLLMNVIQYGSSNKPQIHYMIEPPQEEYIGEFTVHVFKTTCIETLTYYFANAVFVFDDGIVGSSSSMYIIDNLFYFVPVSFAFEVVFDLFHYVTHRLSHEIKFLYLNVHKKHHTHTHPQAVLTYYHNPVDVIFTNSIPQILTLCVVPRPTRYQWIAILVYKSFIEISGHTGKALYPTGSFTQFVWLPRFFGIQLYAEDHDLHHTHSRCNYAKRFSLWDKLFGTYRAFQSFR